MYPPISEIIFWLEYGQEKNVNICLCNIINQFLFIVYLKINKVSLTESLLAAFWHIVSSCPDPSQLYKTMCFSSLSKGLFIFAFQCGFVIQIYNQLLATSFKQTNTSNIILYEWSRTRLTMNVTTFNCRREVVLTHCSMCDETLQEEMDSSRTLVSNKI